jgi:hypothetical protein
VYNLLVSTSDLVKFEEGERLYTYPLLFHCPLLLVLLRPQLTVDSYSQDSYRQSHMVPNPLDEYQGIQGSAMLWASTFDSEAFRTGAFKPGWGKHILTEKK